MANTPLIDAFGREIEYLRISVTDRCDFRCTYCMAEEMTFTPRNQLLSLEELMFIGQTFIELGVSRIRLTGGEPLIRKGVAQLASALSESDPDLDLSMTTNGSRLGEFAEALRASGVKRLNVSLDTLSQSRFKKLTRTGELSNVLNGLEVAKTVGFERIKLNCVALRGQNDDELSDLVAFARDKHFDISFIEEMPLGETTAHNRKDAFLPSSEIRELLANQFQLTPSQYTSGGPSRYWSVAGSDIRVGFISPNSHNFCDTCNRVRLTAEGRLLLCLGNEHSVDLRAIIRAAPFNKSVLIGAIKNAMTLKPEKHHFNLEEPPQILRFMNATGG